MQTLFEHICLKGHIVGPVDQDCGDHQAVLVGYVRRKLHMDLRHAVDGSAFGKVDPAHAGQLALHAEIDLFIELGGIDSVRLSACELFDIRAQVRRVDDPRFGVGSQSGFNTGIFIPGVICGKCAVDVALRQNRRQILRVVVDIVQKMGEPSVHQILPENPVDQHAFQIVVSVLMPDDVHRHAGLLKGADHQIRMLRSHIEIIEPLDDQRGALNIFPFPAVIQRLPDGCIIPVRRRLVDGCLTEISAVILVKYRPVIILEKSACIVERQEIRIIDAENLRDALRVGVVIPAGDSGKWDDRAQAFHAGRGHFERNGAAV